MAVKAGSSHHVVLSKANGTGETGLMLAPNREGVLYGSRLLPELPTRDLEAHQRSWHRGFGDYFHTEGDPHRYAHSDGVDLRFANTAQLAPKLESLVTDADAALVVNGDFESNALAQWSEVADADTYINNLSIGRSSAEANGGNWSYRLAGTHPSRGGDWLYFQLAALEVTDDPASFGLSVGTTLPIVVYSKGERASGTAPRVYISAYLAGANYVFSESNSTIGRRLSFTDDWVENVSNVQVQQVYLADSTHLYLVVSVGYYIHQSEFEVFLDDLSIPIVATGESGKVTLYKGALYLAGGQAVYKRNATSGVFEQANDFFQDVTDITVHGDYLVVGLANNRYAYWDGGSGSWIQRTLSFKPDFIDSAINTKGVNVMYMTNLPNTIYYNTTDSITDTPSSSEKATVGNAADNVVALHKAFDSVMVGKEDGLYYRRVFRGTNWTPENIFAPAALAAVKDDINYKAGQEFIDGWFYFGSNLGLERLQFGSDGRVVLDNVNPAFSAPQYPHFGGPIEGLISDGLYLYAIQCAEDLDGTYTMNILSGSHENTPDRKNIVWHVLHQAPFSPPLRDVFFDKEEGALILFGNTLNINTLAVSPLHQNPLRAVSPSLESTGWFITSIFDYADQGFHNEVKSYNRIRVWVDDAAAGQTVLVQYQVDGDIDLGDVGEWADVGDPIDAGDVALRSFPVGASGRRMRLRLVLTTDDPAKTPILRAFTVYASPSPERSRFWEMLVPLDTGQQLLSGGTDPRTADEILQGVRTLEREHVPILLKTIENPDDGYDVEILDIQEELLERTFQPPGTTEPLIHQARVARLTAREVLR